MSEMLALTPRRMIAPVTAVFLAVALAAALALGFGIRTWTEHTTTTIIRPQAPAAVVHVAPSTPFSHEPLRKLGRPS